MYYHDYVFQNGEYINDILYDRKYEDDIPQDLNVNNNEDEEFPEQIRSELIKLGLY